MVPITHHPVVMFIKVDALIQMIPEAHDYALPCDKVYHTHELPVSANPSLDYLFHVALCLRPS